MHLPILKAGDNVEIIAPASRCSDFHLTQIKELLTSWDLNCVIAHDIFGDDLLCANSDEKRYHALKQALQRTENKAIVCARGGYGSMRLIPLLCKITPINPAKLFVGMSDVTALHLYLQNQWHWPVIHGSLSRDKFSDESIASLKSLLFAHTTEIKFCGIPLNSLAKQNIRIETLITGGNLSLVQTSIGTHWQINARGKMIFLEEISERGYRIDRMLEHLRQANCFKHANAILFGDFLEGDEPDGSSLILPVLERFAQTCDIPVVKIAGIGHGNTNYPMVLGGRALLELGNSPTLTSYRAS